MSDAARIHAIADGTLAIPGRWLTGVATIACVAAAAITYTSITYGPAPVETELSPGRAAAVIVAAAALVLLARVPRLVLILLAAFVYLNLSEVLVRYHGWPSLLQLVVVPIGIVALAASSSVHRAKVLTHPLTIALAVYVLVVFAATTVARDSAIASERSNDLVKTFILALLVALLARRLPDIRIASWTMVACGTLLALLGIVQVATNSYASEYGGFARIKYAHIFGTTFEPRISGPLGDPNFFSQSLLILVPIAVILAIHERRVVLRCAAALAGCIITAGTILTYSRGGALALCCAIALLVAGSIRHLRRTHAFAIAGVVAAVVLFAPREFMQRLTTLQQLLPGGEGQQLADTSFEERRLLTTAAWLTFVDHPFAGVGPGNYTHYFDDYAGLIGSTVIEYEVQDATHYPHNLYLEIAAETGLFGLAAFGAVLVVAFAALKRAKAAFRNGGSSLGPAMVAALQASIAGYLVSSLFLHGSHQRYLWLLFGLTIALSTAAARSTNRTAARFEAAS